MKGQRDFVPAANPREAPGPFPAAAAVPWAGRIIATLYIRGKEGGFVAPWERQGELGNQRRAAEGLWRTQG